MKMGMRREKVTVRLYHLLQWDGSLTYNGDLRHWDFLYWLSPADYGARQADLIAQRQEGTGQWFLKSPKFAAFVEGSTRTLLCPGIPGAGKTFMTAIAVNYLRERFANSDDVGVAVVYCSYSIREEQTEEKLLAALLRQLVKPKHSESERFRTLYETCKRAERGPVFSELSSLLGEVTATYSTVYIVVDALDECEGTMWSTFLTEIQRVQALIPILKLMTTFRPHVAVAKELPETKRIEIRADSRDLERYVTEHISRLSKSIHETEGLQKEVVDGIVIAADGM
jgi:Cdc6-like AAA superfamily ATPase